MASPPAPPDLPLRLRRVIETLRSVIAAHAGRNRAAVPVVLLLWPYLHRLATRFESLVQRVQAGLAPPRPGGPRAVPAGQERPPRSQPRLPRGFAWLIRLAPETAPFGTQLRVWLADPEFLALLTAAPQAGRILRPLCTMLGIQASPDVPATLFSPPARKTLPTRERPPSADASAPWPQDPLAPSVMSHPTQPKRRSSPAFRPAPA